MLYIKTKLDFKEQKSYNKDEDIYIPSAELLIEYEELIEFSDEYVLERLNDTVDELTCKFGDIKKDELEDLIKYIYENVIYCNLKKYEKEMEKYASN